MCTGRSILAVIVAALAAQAVHAQEIGDRHKGGVLARQVCAECHAVGRRTLRSPNPLSPSFVSVAATPGMTATALNVFLHTSHRNMPNIILSADQASDITAYILSLKK